MFFFENVTAPDQQHDFQKIKIHSYSILVSVEMVLIFGAKIRVDVINFVRYLFWRYEIAT
tara:strand:+ start:318 stop:497 length:180 start_codon:yes stop_codon:yes gene_type:complete